jgi:type IV secretion system protein VirD4
MASLLARVFAALRGAGIPSPTGRDLLPYEPQVRSVGVRARPSLNGAHNAPADRTTRIAGFRVKRLRQIAAFYADGAHEAVVTVGDCAFLPEAGFHDAAELVVRMAREPPSALIATENAVRRTMLKRRLGELSDRERAILRAADLLCELGEFDRAAALRMRLPVVWNEGRCQIAAAGFETTARRNLLRAGLHSLFGEFATPAPKLFDELRRAWRNALSLDATLSEEEHKVLESCQFIERSWRAPAEPDDDAAAPAALTLGLFAGTDRPLVYDDSHGLITIAPAQSAKRQGQITQTLLRLAAGAVVIDVDGKAFNATARRRQKDAGEILAFAPALSDHSMHYNPIDGVSRDPAKAWTEARLLADLLTGRHGPDDEGRNFVAPAIYDVALSDRPERRHMRGVLARVACSGKQLEAWTAALARSPHRELVRHGEALRALPDKQREALATRLMRELAIWQTPPVADLVDRSDWTPIQLRRGATLYLCGDRRDLERFAVVLRTIIGQTIATLSRDKMASAGSTVTLFLDEAARLGPMGTIAHAVDTGPQCGVRPWMFFASSAEMRAIYPNADGMIASCAAHCYIEPDREIAHELALRLGFVKSLFGADEKPMVSPADLAGPDYADKIIALVRNQPPARLVLPGELKTAQRRER